MGGYVAVRADDDGAALRGLASFVGLNADGSDPRAEVERLRALLAVTRASLEAASSGRRVTACEDIERLQRETLRLRSLLPAVAFIRCPTCGTDRDAELDDDAVYVMRRHPRRTTRDGYDEMMWCDGGVVSEVKR